MDPILFSLCGIGLFLAGFIVGQLNVRRFYGQEIKRIEDRHHAELERLQGALVYRDIEPMKTAERIEPAPDPEDRLSRIASEETIAAGAAAIKADYQIIGVPISEEEARLQAIAILAGTPLEVDGPTGG